MTVPSWEYAVAADVRPPEPGVSAIVRDAWLPIGWWRAVPVYRWGEQALTDLELFVLEAAASLGTLDGAELTEITGLPGALLPALARRLSGAGVLVPAGGGYTVDRTRADAVLRERTVRTPEVGRIDLVLLMPSEEIVAVVPRPGQDPLAALDNRKLDPAYQVPVPDSLRGATRGRFVDDAVRGGRVTGLPPEVHAAVVPDQDQPLFTADHCPVYQCSAVVRETGGGLRTALTVHGESVRRRRGDTGSPRRQVTLDLDAPGLARAWSGDDPVPPGRTLPGTAWSALTGGSIVGPPPAVRTGPMACRLQVGGTHLDALARTGRNLSRPVVLAVRRFDHTVHVVVELDPADGRAAARLAVDRIIAEADAGGDAGQVRRALAAATASVPADYRRLLGEDAVLRRAWELGRYRLAYGLRQDGDFRYA